MKHDINIDKLVDKFTVVNMNGTEYLNYKKYLDRKDINKIFNKKILKFIYDAKFFIYALFLYAMGTWFINTIFPVKYTPVNFGIFVLNGFMLPYVLIYFIAIAIAIAWVIHGFGFIVIKR